MGLIVSAKPRDVQRAWKWATGRHAICPTLPADFIRITLPEPHYRRCGNHRRSATIRGMKLQFSLATLLVCMTVLAVLFAACVTIPVADFQDVVTRHEMPSDGQIRKFAEVHNHQEVSRAPKGTEVTWRLIFSWPLAFLISWLWIFRRNIKPKFSTSSLFLIFAFLAVAFAGVTFAGIEFGDINPKWVPINLAAFSPIWVPFAFAAYAIGRRKLTWPFIAAFAAAEAQAFALLHYIW
jgi:hypothetical protein